MNTLPVKRPAATSRQEVKKRRARTGAQHKWNRLEVTNILAYMKKTVLKNETIEVIP